MCMSEGNTRAGGSRTEAERLKAMRAARNIQRFGFSLGQLKTRLEWQLLQDRSSRRDV